MDSQLNGTEFFFLLSSIGQDDEDAGVSLLGRRRRLGGGAPPRRAGGGGRPGPATTTRTRLRAAGVPATRRWAKGRVLPPVVPGHGGHRPASRQEGHRRRLHPRPRPPPPLLPRLRRRGHRRVRAGGLAGEREVRQGEQDAAGIRAHRVHQGRAGGQVPQNRLLRRHPRRRRPRRQLRGEGGLLAADVREEGREEVEHGGRRPVRAHGAGERDRPHRLLRVEGAHRAGPRRPLRRAHHRPRHVRRREAEAVGLRRHGEARRHHEPALRRLPPPQVPRRRRRRRVRVPRRRHADGVRQRLLQEPAARHGPPGDRPEATAGLENGGVRQAARRAAGADQAPVRRVHAPPRRRAGAHRQRRRGPHQVLRHQQLLVLISMSISNYRLIYPLSKLSMDA